MSSSTCHKCKAKCESSQSFTLKLCSHVFCYQCLCKYIQSNIQCKITCPICPVKISDQIIRKCLSNIQTKLYEQLCINFSNPKARKCLTPECPIIKIIENDNTIFHCDYCDQPNCLRCKKRHYPSQCGLNIDEGNINSAAAEKIKKKKHEELKNFGNLTTIPNPDSFECPICSNFILPREGLIARNCHHCYCKACFKDLMTNIENIVDFKCPECNQDINQQEINHFLPMPSFRLLNCKAVALKMFCCKYPNCNGMWDKNNAKGTYVCLVCNHSNCLDCEDIHENESCETFRKTPRYRNAQAAKLRFHEAKGVKCICGKKLIIAPGGCSAIYCDNCRRHICQFTGKEAGNLGSESCGCTSVKPCHKDCIFGCFPESIRKK